MFDVAPSEFLIVAVVALIVIGPKDLPRVMRVVGKWVGKARGVARHFRSGFDTMVREAELEEMESRWKAENARIMQEHPATPADGVPPADLSPPGLTDMPMLPLAQPVGEAAAPVEPASAPIEVAPVEMAPVEMAPVKPAPIEPPTHRAGPEPTQPAVHSDPRPLP